MVYDYKVKDVKGNEVSLGDYQGKVLLIVNTATGCGFTPQYEGLQKLYDKYGDRGLEVLDFPSNQFFEQAPGTNEELADFCKLNYGTTFQTFGKINVNGEHVEPLYQYLKSQAPEARENDESKAFYDKVAQKGFVSAGGSDIRWNFTKFLISKEGKVVERFAPTVKPEQLEGTIEELLK